MKLSSLVAFAVITASLPATAQPVEALELVVCYPGGPVRSRDARPAIDSMARMLEQRGKWKKDTISIHLTTAVGPCRALLKKINPPFALLSIGLYLEHRKQLVPLVQPRIDGSTNEVYRLVAKKEKHKTLEALKGKTVGGALLDEPLFLEKIIFAGRIKPETYFSLKPSRRALRALRRLNKGKLDGVLLNRQQYKSLGSLDFADQLTVVYTSPAVPLMGIVANEKRTTENLRTRLTEAFVSMCKEEKGKELCKLFGVDEFVAAHPKAFVEIEEMWQSGS